MTSSLEARLGAAISSYLEASGRLEACRRALDAMRGDFGNEAGQNRLGSIIAEMQSITRPLDDVLQEAWAASIARASSQGLVRTPEGGETHAGFDALWVDLARDGWSNLAAYEQADLTGALARTQRNVLFDPRIPPEGDHNRLAARILADIESGTVPCGRGAGDIFTNWADGASLDVEMTGWVPRLTHQGKPPTRSPDGLVFRTRLDIVSDRVLVADSIRIAPAPDLIGRLCDTLSLNINYGWHRVLRTAHAANLLCMVDVSMGDDGPGLVRAPGSEMIFSACETESFPLIADVCHDYWGTTMIDRQKLVEAMLTGKSATSPEDAEATIDAWLAASPFHGEIAMTPGAWYFYWDDDRETLAAELEASGLDAPKGVRFALSRTELPIPEHRLRDLALPLAAATRRPNQQVGSFSRMFPQERGALADMMEAELSRL